MVLKTKTFKKKNKIGKKIYIKVKIFLKILKERFALLLLFPQMFLKFASFLFPTKASLAKYLQCWIVFFQNCFLWKL